METPLRILAPTLALTGGLLDTICLVIYAVIIDDAIESRAPLSAGRTIIAIGVAVIAVMGMAIILTAILLWAINLTLRSLADRVASYSEGVVDGAREGVSGVVEHLVNALPLKNDNVRSMHPSRGRSRR
ncbi:hypothetical protein [Micromonospora maritima]|uniref:hypothetical protein n=1 Tax=Micromonospora maritima TaxID=986711 RepID=UPI00157DD686|nr:hypothetical protein [Micromonospora maritima]